MAKCDSCRGIKREVLPFGGSMLCSSCMNTYNPKTDRIHRFNGFDIKWREERILELKKELSVLEFSMTQNKRLFENHPDDVKNIDVIVGYWDY